MDRTWRNIMDSFITTYIPVDSAPWHLAMVPDGSRIYVTHLRSPISDLSDVVSVIDTTQNAVVAEIHLDSPADFIAVSPDGAYLYVSHFPELKLSVIATISNAVVTIPLTDSPLLLAVTPDGGHVYVAGSTSLSVVDTTTYAVSLVVNLYPVNFQGLAVAPNGGRVYVTRSGERDSNGLMLVFDTTTMPPTVVAAIEMSNPTSVAVSPDGSRCYVINERLPVTTFIDEVWVIDTTTNVVLDKISRNTTLASVAPASKGHRLYVTTGGAPAEVWVIDTTTNAVVTSFPLDGQASDLAVYARDVTVHDIYVSSSPLNKVSHTVSVAPFETGELLSYGDAGTPGNVSDPVVVGFGGWQVFKFR